jgi:hypothetical protein
MINMKKIFTLLLVSLLVVKATHSISSENAIIKGRVVSFEDSLPLEGVRISVKGSNINTSSGSNGSFSLDVPGNCQGAGIRVKRFRNTGASYRDQQSN